MENSKVIAEAKKLGLDKVGFCSAKDFNQNFKSVIAAVFPYYTGKIDEHFKILLWIRLSQGCCANSFPSCRRTRIERF